MKEKARTRKDRIFIIVMAIIVANLTYMLLMIIPYLVIERPVSGQPYALAIANIIGIIGALWLVHSYRLSKRDKNGY